MAYQFLYRTNKMNTDGVIDYLFDLLNKDKEDNQKISKYNVVDLVENYLPSTSELNGSGFLDELQEQVGVADSEEYISQKETLDDAVKDFFNGSEHDFANDLWDVDPEVEIVNSDGSKTEERETLDIENYKEWDF